MVYTEVGHNKFRVQVPPIAEFLLASSAWVEIVGMISTNRNFDGDPGEWSRGGRRRSIRLRDVSL